MSTFRPPQVPIQPQTYFTPGQALGIPKAFTDPQFQQIEAYFRQRPDNEAYEVATLVSRRLFTPGQPLGIPKPIQSDQTHATWRAHIDIPLPPPTPATLGTPLGIPQPRQSDQVAAYFRPRPDTEAQEVTLYIVNPNVTASGPSPFIAPQPLQIPFTARWPIEWIVNLYDEFNNKTVAQPLGIPNPQQSDQVAAYFRPRPDTEAAEYVLHIVNPNSTPALPLALPNPVQSDQVAAFFRPRPDTEAGEVATRVVNANLTAGQPLGIPQPVQGTQWAAYFRQRPDTEAGEAATQLVNANVTAGAPSAFVPAPQLQIPFNARWPIEWIVGLIDTTNNKTTAQPLGIPNPQQSDQTQATWRARIEISQPPQLFAQPSPVVFVVAPDYLGFEETPDEPPLQVSTGLTIGQPLGIPKPIQSDQTQATWRARIEILQPTPASLTQSAPQLVVPPLPLQIPFTARWPIEWIVGYMDSFNNFTIAQPLGIPNPQQSDQTQAAWRQRIEIIQPVYFAPIPPPQFYAPKYEFQMAAYMRGWRPDTEAGEEATQVVNANITAGQPLGIPQPKQSDQTAAYWRQRWDLEAFEYSAAAFSDNVLPPQPQFVPAPTLQMPYGPSARYESAIILQQSKALPATAHMAVQSDQYAAYFRPRVENWQPPQKFTIGSPVITQGGIGERIVLVASDRLIMLVDIGGKQILLSDDGNTQINLTD